MKKNNEIKILKDLLKRKIDFIFWNVTIKNLFNLKGDFISIVFKTKELKDPLIKIILDHRIDNDWLQSTFNEYMMTQMFYHVDINDILEKDGKKTNSDVAINFTLPVFLCKETIKKLDYLMENYKEFMKIGFEESDEMEKYENKRKEANEIGLNIVASDEEYRIELYNLKKLYLDLITELDLMSLSNQNESIFIENKDQQVLKINNNIKEKIDLLINKNEKSILREDNNKKYIFRKSRVNNRFGFLIQISQNPLSSSKDLSNKSYSYVSGEIKKINKVIKEKLNLRYDLISNNEKDRGYKINEDFFNIKLI